MNTFNKKNNNSINYINISFGIFFFLIISFSFFKFSFIGDGLDTFVFQLLLGQFKYIFYILFFGLILYSFIKKGNVKVWKIFLFFLFVFVIYISIYIIYYKTINIKKEPNLPHKKIFKKILFLWKVGFLNLKKFFKTTISKYEFKMIGNSKDFLKNFNENFLNGFSQSKLLNEEKLIFDTFNILAIKAFNKVTLLIPCFVLFFNIIIFICVIYFSNNKYNSSKLSYNSFQNKNFNNLNDFSKPYYNKSNQNYNMFEQQKNNNFNNTQNTFSNLKSFNTKNNIKKQYLDPNEIFNKEIIKENFYNNNKIDKNSLLDQNNMLINDDVYNSKLLNNNPISQNSLNNTSLNNNISNNNLLKQNQLKNNNNNLNNNTNNLLNGNDILVNNNYQNNINPAVQNNIKSTNKILIIVNKVSDMIKNFGIKNVENAIFSLDPSLEQNEVNEILNILKIRKLI